MRTSAINLMPTRNQFNMLHARLRQAGWAYSHSIMGDEGGQSGLKFGSCFIRNGITIYVNFLTAELISLTLDSELKEAAKSNAVPAIQNKPTYAVKCDDCRKDILLTHSLQESVQGGVCDDCAAARQLASEDYFA